MPKLQFATERTFRERNREASRARRGFNRGIAVEYRKHHKIFTNDFKHLYSTGMPFGSSG